jgi:hypothetical protein
VTARTLVVLALLAASLVLSLALPQGLTAGQAAGDPASADTLRLLGEPVAIAPDLSSVASGDLTGDGRIDLLLTRRGGVTLLVGDGSGRFVRRQGAEAGENPVDVAVGDLDGDGDLDAAVANHETDYVTLLANDGRGGLSAYPGSPLHLELAPHPHAVELRDMDGDGRVDLLVDDRRGEAILLLPGRADGSFAAETRRIDVGGDPYRGLALVDLDGDGWTDVVTPNGSAVAIVRRTEEGGYEPPRLLAAPGPFEVGAADLDGDGRPDLVVAGEPGTVRVVRGAGAGPFRDDPWFELRWSPGAKAVATGDFDGDGFGDAAITNWEEPEALVLFGGEGGIRTQRVPGGENPWGVGAADLDGDGRDELLVLAYTGGELRVYSSSDR